MAALTATRVADTNMQDASSIRLKQKAKRAMKFAGRKGYDDPDKVNYPTKEAYERHEATELPEEDAVERQLAKKAK